MITLETYLQGQFEQDLDMEFDKAENILTQFKHSNYQTAKTCFRAFHSARGQVQTEEMLDRLCLQLTAFLACWGMYRGSSFLKDCHYTIHRPVVETLLRTEYDDLSGLRLDRCSENTAVSIMKLYKAIAREYEQKKKEVNQKTGIQSLIPTDTLVTKVLLATLACIPGYDTNVKKAFSVLGLQQAFPKKSVEGIAKMLDFCKEKNTTAFAAVKQLGLNQTDMQMWDFVLFHYGKYLKECDRK